MRAVLVVKDDDFGFEDDVLGVAEIEFATSDFMMNPGVSQQCSIKLSPGDVLGNIMDTMVHPAPPRPAPPHPTPLPHHHSPIHEARCGSVRCLLKKAWPARNHVFTPSDLRSMFYWC